MVLDTLFAPGLGKGLEGKAFEDIINTDELVCEDDLAAALVAPTPTTRSGKSFRAGGGSGSGRQRSATPEKQQASELLRADSMSARERNKLKRKYRALQRQDSVKADAKGRVSRCGCYRALTPAIFSVPFILVPEGFGASPARDNIRIVLSGGGLCVIYIRVLQQHALDMHKQLAGCVRKPTEVAAGIYACWLLSL